MAIPVSLEDARRQIRLDEGDASLDADLTNFIADAAEWAEDYTGHILAAREVTEQFCGFKPAKLRAWPIAETVVPVVSFRDAAGSSVTVRPGVLDVSSRPAVLRPSGYAFWPQQRTGDVFTVTIRAGYETADEVPRAIRRAMLILISAYDSDRAGGKIFQEAEASARLLCRDLRWRGL